MVHRQLEDKFMFRMPDGLRERIKAVATANRRSMNAELLFHMERIFSASEAATGEAPDPIFVAIAEHRAAWEWADKAPTNEHLKVAGAVEVSIMRALLRTVPRTVPGMLAYLDYLETAQVFRENCLSDDDARAIIAVSRQFISGRV